MKVDDIVKRREWGARTARRTSRIPTPTRELWLHHTAGNERGVAGIRSIQSFHMNTRGWSDIAYSYLIDRESLVVYEGRGAGVLGGHTFGRNSISHAICVMGNFDNYQPTPALVSRVAELVRLGHEQGWWPSQLTGGHRDVRSTSCPGNYLYLLIDEINRQAVRPEEPNVDKANIERVERVAASLGYSDIDVDGKLSDREAAAVENMELGINNLINERNSLRDQLAEAIKDSERIERIEQVLRS